MIKEEHIEALSALADQPGGYSRKWLETVRKFAMAKSEWNAVNPVKDVSCGHSEWMNVHIKEKRERENRRLREIAANCRILLEGTPEEYEEAAIELEHWMDEDPSNIAYQAFREVSRDS